MTTYALRAAAVKIYAQILSKIKRNSQMFPKTHKKNTRKEEFYKVHHATIWRYQKSSIIYMQNLLNEYEKLNKKN